MAAVVRPVRTALLLVCGAAIAAALLVASSCTTLAPTAPSTEFRGVWLATVNNLDWPSRPGLSTADQQRELLEILDRMAALGLNVIVFQVRPSSDALYASDIEPWSEALTGTMGKAPDPYWDPLQFAVEQAHRRGMELHAWINPYRAHQSASSSPIAPSHISRTRPDLVRQYGSYLWLDPGEPAVRQHVVGIVGDIVRRYDVDGIHIDDYFYPYPERDASKHEIDFPDQVSYDRYRSSGGALERNDWRRKNVNDLVESVARTIHEEKPRVKFGISPFGIWRPGNPASVRGFDAWSGIYTDARKWLQEGWVDYLSPQLYWASSAPDQRFGDLLRWWRGENTMHRGLFPGLAAYRVGSGRTNGWSADEIASQIRQIRSRGGSPGWILFRAGILMENRGGLADRIAGLTRTAAKVPGSY